MSDYSEVTAENLRFVRGAKGMNQDDVAAVLGLKGYHVSNIEKGRRALADVEKRLLDWYFFGIIPAKITRASEDLKGILEFDEAEWRAICIMATRDGGRTPGEWIASRVRDHIALGLSAEGDLRAALDKPAAGNPEGNVRVIHRDHAEEA